LPWWRFANQVLPFDTAIQIESHCLKVQRFAEIGMRTWRALYSSWIHFGKGAL
jgi:hypothetical protein